MVDGQRRQKVLYLFELRQPKQGEGYAAKKREEKKCEKYNNERLPGGTSPTFTPLVLGHWGSAAESFLSELAKKSRELEGNTNYAEFKNVWKKCLSVALQKCHGRVILKKVSRLSHGKNAPDGLFTCDIHSHVH